MIVTLEQVKNALGITGDYQDATLQVYFDEVMAFLIDAGVPKSVITAGIVARGVADLWNYGGAEGKLSDYFIKRAIQLAYRYKGTTVQSSDSGDDSGGGDDSGEQTELKVIFGDVVIANDTSFNLQAAGLSAIDVTDGKAVVIPALKPIRPAARERIQTSVDPSGMVYGLIQVTVAVGPATGGYVTPIIAGGYIIEEMMNKTSNTFFLFVSGESSDAPVITFIEK